MKLEEAQKLSEEELKKLSKKEIDKMLEEYLYRKHSYTFDDSIIQD